MKTIAMLCLLLSGCVTGQDCAAMCIPNGVHFCNGWKCECNPPSVSK